MLAKHAQRRQPVSQTYRHSLTPRMYAAYDLTSHVVLPAGRFLMHAAASLSIIHGLTAPPLLLPRRLAPAAVTFSWGLMCMGAAPMVGEHSTRT